MADDATYTRCPGCGVRVEPTDPGVIYGVELMRLDTFGGGHTAEGMGGYFHTEHCFARMTGWKRKPNPEH